MFFSSTLYKMRTFFWVHQVEQKTLILYVTEGRGLFSIHFTPIGLKYFVCNGGVFVTYRNMNTF